MYNVLCTLHKQCTCIRCIFYVHNYLMTLSLYSTKCNDKRKYMKLQFSHTTRSSCVHNLTPILIANTMQPTIARGVSIVTEL